MDRRNFNRLIVSFGFSASVAPGLIEESARLLAYPSAGPRTGRESLPSVGFDKLCYRVGDRPFYLYSGEFHYFRVPKKDWRRRMELFRAAGGNCIATYIPWLIHEPEEGQFTFGGSDGVTDFEGFLDTAQEAGLYVIARPGPYQYSELKYGGLPAWLFEKYPQILARTIEDRPIHGDSVSYVYPVFLEKAGAWYEQVCPIIARHTLSRRGPIAFVQIDNEMMGVHLWNGTADYNRDSMGFGQIEGRYPRYLRRNYKDIQELNATYGTNYASFEAVRPIAVSSTSNPNELRRMKDYFEFYLESTAEYAQILANWLHKHDIDVPLVHNSGGVDMDVLYEDIARALRPNFLLGSDHYYELDQNWAQNNPTPQYALKIFCSLEILRLMGFPPTVMELPGGSGSDWPPVTPQDARACYWANLALGMKGNNFYIFTGGPNPPGVGTTSDIYDYGAAVGADGSIRPLYYVQKELGEFLQQHLWLCAAEREHDFRVAVDLHGSIADNYWKSRGDFLLTDAEAWDLTRRGVLNSGFCASLSPILCDLRSDDWVGDKTTPVVIVSSSCMEADQQKRVMQFLRAGGKALILPVLPSHDDNFKRCTLLSDFLGSPRIHANDTSFPRITIAGVVNIENNMENFVTATLPAQAQVIGNDETTGIPIAWQLKTEGNGEVIFLGFRWFHTMHEHERMMKTLLERLGLKQIVLCSNPNVWTSLRTGENKSSLFILNLSSSPMEAQITCRPRLRPQAVDTGNHKLPAMTVKYVDVYPGS